jgi:hypothetical protein
MFKWEAPGLDKMTSMRQALAADRLIGDRDEPLDVDLVRRRLSPCSSSSFSDSLL